MASLSGCAKSMSPMVSIAHLTTAEKKREKERNGGKKKVSFF